MSDIATRRDCDIIATLSVATISQPCGSRYTDKIDQLSMSKHVPLELSTSSDSHCLQ